MRLTKFEHWLLRRQEALRHREKLQIVVEAEPSDNIYKAVRSFEEAGFPPSVLVACRCALAMWVSRLQRNT